jgi:predicted oxidoreductase
MAACLRPEDRDTWAIRWARAYVEFAATENTVIGIFPCAS